jgi:acyl carrier protein
MLDEEVMKQIMHKVSPELTLDADKYLDTSFKELGLDSLDVFSLMSEVEDLCGVSINDDEFVTILTPRNLIDFVNRDDG